MARFTLRLDEYTLRKLIKAAQAADVTPGRMAGMMLEAWVRDEVEPDPERAQPGVDEPARAWAGAADVEPDPHTTLTDHGAPVVELVEPMRSRFAGMARAGGLPPEVLAAAILDSRLFDHDDFEWPEGGDPRDDRATNHDLNEVGRPWSDVRPEFMALIDKTFGKAE